MAVEVEIGKSTWAKVLSHPKVREAVAAAAASRLSRVKYAAYQSGRAHFGDSLRVVTGIRPGTKAVGGLQRPYARIEGRTTEKEDAEDSRKAKLSRSQILRRAL